MSDVAIRVENLGKKFRIGTREPYLRLSDVPARACANAWNFARNRLRLGRSGSLRDALGGAGSRAPGSDTPAADSAVRSALPAVLPAPAAQAAEESARSAAPKEFWALKDVSFEVHRGEVLGIIGRNGAGKSTLLKILSRITRPTEGEIRIRGRIGSLLEVGTGFHPELTGRENIFLNGTILGMRRSEIARKFDEIVAFAEIEPFLDTAVKHYSSGMYMRLAFAVAAHLEPEILIVDEVLAVGDAEFQKKCLGKMGEVARGGRTVLFVSHNMAAVSKLCGRAALIERGAIRGLGECGGIVSMYTTARRSEPRERLWPNQATAPGNDRIRVKSLRLLDDAGAPIDRVTLHTAINVVCEYWNSTPGSQLCVTFHVQTDEGGVAFTTSSASERGALDRRYPAGLIRVRCRIPGDLLNDGGYRITAFFVQDTTIPLFVLEDAFAFEVIEDDRQGHWHGRTLGALRPHLDWTTSLPSAEDLSWPRQ